MPALYICRDKGIGCEFATNLGYCNHTVCVKSRKPYYMIIPACVIQDYMDKERTMEREMKIGE